MTSILSTPLTDLFDAAQTPLHERVRLLTGASSWTLHALPAAGLRSIVVSDGPIGVRGVDEDDTPSAQLPSPSAWAATFDRRLLERLGALLRDEARRKGVDVVLAPVVNLQRTPFGGRHFEMFSEDPHLTGELAVHLIRSTQLGGVAMCVKHFVGNETETERTSYISRISERALREVYLAPFERAVKDAQVWSVMTAYNGMDDGIQSAPATEHASLVAGVLKDEWGFDGVVMSDWLATTSTVPSALSGLDLVMPGPKGPWGARLEDAVRSGEVDEAFIDDKVQRIIRLGTRVGAVRAASGGEDDVPEDLPSAPATRRLLRDTVARSMVVLRNDGIAPVACDGIGSIALIGPNAVAPFVQGGGSASVTAPHLSAPVDAFREAFPTAEVTLVRGTSGRKHPAPIEPGRVTTPDGAPGYRLTFFDEAGAPVGQPRIVDASEGWNREVPLEAVEALIEALVRLDEPALHTVQVGVSGAHRIRFDGAPASESAVKADHDVILNSSANHPDGPSIEIAVDTPRAVLVESRQQVVDASAYGRFVRFVLRHERRVMSEDAELGAAAATAAAADIAVVIVGTNEETESEGWDRPSLDLPGRQNELVERVLAANPRAIVVVNAGAPVILPWLERAPAVLWWWLPGQEAGVGLVDALTGQTEPSGRLPWTLPAHEDGLPDTVPVDGVVDYTEGIHIGYRGWDLAERVPAREFGYGLGYGAWRYDAIALEGDVDDLTAVVTLTNIGVRDAHEVVQLYAEAPGSIVERPIRWLAGFETVDVPAGHTRTVRVDVPLRALQTWNSTDHRWVTPEGRYLIHAAHSSRDLRLTAETIVVDGHSTTPETTENV